MTFAPYVLSYPNLQAHLEDSNLSKAHCWGNVIDFRWHKKTESPNWKRLEQAAWVAVTGPDGWTPEIQGQDVAAGAGTVATGLRGDATVVQEAAVSVGNDDDDDDDDDEDDEI